MTNIESYLVAIIFTAASGFSFGYGEKTMEMFNARELKKSAGLILTLIGLTSIVAVAIYGIRWGLRTDGNHFIWIPALVAWLFAQSFGKKLAVTFKADLVPWRLPTIGAIIVIISFYALPNHQ